MGFELGATHRLGKVGSTKTLIFDLLLVFSKNLKNNTQILGNTWLNVIGHLRCVCEVLCPGSGEFRGIGSGVYFARLSSFLWAGAAATANLHQSRHRCVLTSYVTGRIGERLIAGDIVSEA